MLPGTPTAEAGGSRALPGLDRPGRPRFMLVRIALGLGLIGWLAGSGAIDWARLLGLAEAWPLTVSAVLLLFLTVVLASWRLCLLLAGQGLHMPLLASLRLTLIGALFSNFLPGSSGGDLVRVYLAARPNAGRRAEIATTLVIDRVIGLCALLASPLVVAVAGRGLVPLHESLQAMVWGSACALVAVIAILWVGTSTNVLTQRFMSSAVGRSRAGRVVQRIFDSVDAHRRHRRVVARAFVLSLVIQGLVIAAIQLILKATGSGAASWGAALLTPFGMLANALPLTPGGLGVGEAAFESLFLLAGLTGGAEAILSWRVLTTFIDLTGGVVLIAGRTDAPIRTDAPTGVVGNASVMRRDTEPDAHRV